MLAWLDTLSHKPALQAGFICHRRRSKDARLESTRRFEYDILLTGRVDCNAGKPTPNSCRARIGGGARGYTISFILRTSEVHSKEGTSEMHPLIGLLIKRLLVHSLQNLIPILPVKDHKIRCGGVGVVSAVQSAGLFVVGKRTRGWMPGTFKPQLH